MSDYAAFLAANRHTAPKNGRRERLWMSPACLHTQGTLWGQAP